MIEEAILHTDLDSIKVEKPIKFNIYNDVIEDNVSCTESFFTADDESYSFYDSMLKNDTSSVTIFCVKERKGHSFNYIPSVAFNHVLIKKWINVNRIKSQILNLQKDGKIDITLDYIFDTFDNLLIEKKFDLIDSFFELVEINDFELNSLVGILTITSNLKDCLQLRGSFYQQVYELVNSKYLSQEANQILDGLE